MLILIFSSTFCLSSLFANQTKICEYFQIHALTRMFWKTEFKFFLLPLFEHRGIFPPHQKYFMPFDFTHFNEFLLNLRGEQKRKVNLKRSKKVQTDLDADTHTYCSQQVKTIPSFSHTRYIQIRCSCVASLEIFSISFSLGCL